jgi:hypothetical protein
MGENHPNPCAGLLTESEGPGEAEKELSKSVGANDEDKVKLKDRLAEKAVRISKKEARRAPIKEADLKILLTPPVGGEMR